MTPFPRLGRPLGRPARVMAQPDTRRPRAVRFSRTASTNYAQIKAAVLAALARLPAAERQQIPATATLPEMIVGFSLIRLGLVFQAQHSELGGRLELGGGVVDFKVQVGALVVVIRVQGDYWHSLPERRLKDALQYDRLHRLGYRVWDAWEQELYQAWAEGRILRFVGDGVLYAN